MKRKDYRRISGLIKARVPDLGLGKVEDPRKKKSCFKLSTLLKTTLVGLLSGCKSLRDMESLTAEMGKAFQKQLGIFRRLPDTTLRDILCRLSFEDLRTCIHRQIHAAFRRKALPPFGFPFHAVSMDGKMTAIQTWDDDACSQRHVQDATRVVFGLLRTVTSCLVTALGRPCIDVMPIPTGTNEMGHFLVAFKALVLALGKCFQVVMYDAGAYSKDNANAVVEAQKDYVFRLKGRHEVKKTAELLLGEQTVPKAHTEDVLTNKKSVIRQVFLHEVAEIRRSVIFSKHTKTLIRIRSEIHNHGQIESVEVDVPFAEDDHPWITGNARGALVVLLLRRMAYNLLTLFRSVTQRSEEKRATPWKDLLRFVYNAVIAASAKDILGLRVRKIVPVFVG